MAAHAFDMSSDIVYIFDRLEERYLSVNERQNASSACPLMLLRSVETTYRVRHLRGDYKMLRCKQMVVLPNEGRVVIR